MTEFHKSCPCCNKSVPVPVSQCDGCGYDYQTRVTLSQASREPARIKSAQIKPAQMISSAPNSFVPLTFAAPTLILPPLVDEEEETLPSEPPQGRLTRSKYSSPIFLGSFAAASLILLLVLGGVVMYARQRTPGPQAQALAGLMKPYELTSEKQFTAVFGLPTTRAAKTVQGTPYDFWGYKCSDGAALVTFNIRSNQIERVTAVGSGG